jgi:DNA-binding winged helix-turn-helix (wHTH) protein
MDFQPKNCYEFGPFRLDSAERRLLRNGENVPLTPKAFDLLLVLVRNQGHLLEKDQLMKAVWPEAFVEEANLAYNISLIRKALGSAGNGERYIETVTKHGYRFIGCVREVERITPRAGVADSSNERNELYPRTAGRRKFAFILLVVALTIGIGIGLYLYFRA